MRRPDDCSLTPGQLAIIRREAERALREAGALGVFPTPVENIMSVADVEEVKEDLLSPGLLEKIRAGAEKAELDLRGQPEFAVRRRNAAAKPVEFRTGIFPRLDHAKAHGGPLLCTTGLLRKALFYR
jgi:hypothetical protein